MLVELNLAYGVRWPATAYGEADTQINSKAEIFTSLTNEPICARCATIALSKLRE